MRKSLLSLAGVAGLALLVTGCQGPQTKLGRGLTNCMEPLRGGEMNRSVEQASVFTSPESGYTVGAVHGLCRTISRTAMGIYEVATFPLPNHCDGGTGSYAPVGTPGFKASPEYPDSYKPGWLSGDSTMTTDQNLGVQELGDVAPMIPGSHFRIFDN